MVPHKNGARELPGSPAPEARRVPRKASGEPRFTVRLCLRGDSNAQPTGGGSCHRLLVAGQFPVPPSPSRLAPGRALSFPP